MARKNCTRITAALGASALALAACSSAGADDEDMSVTIGYVTWDEVVAATYLWEYILEEEGFEVEVLQLEPAVVYQAVGESSADLYIGGLPETHHDYWDRYGDGFESVVVWYEPLVHSLAVPEYVDAESIEDLAGRADEFGGQIVGIEAGAGLMQELDAATEAYDLDGYEVIESSTAAMLAEFERAVNNEDPIVAAAWSPHWAVGEYNMRLLEDPHGSFTAGDQYQVIASEEAQEKERLMELLAGFEMDDDAFYSLLGEFSTADSEREAVLAWLEEPENTERVDGWIGD